MFLQRRVGTILELGQHVAGQGRGEPLEHQHQNKLQCHHVPAHGDDETQHEEEEAEEIVEDAMLEDAPLDEVEEIILNEDDMQDEI